MVQRIFIIHRWDGGPSSDWYSWLSSKLKEKGYEVQVPVMPDTETPRIESWLKQLAEIVGDLNQDTHFVCHSIGCQAVLRYLAKSSKSAGQVVCVGGWFELTGLETEEEKQIAKAWLEPDIDFAQVKKNMTKCIAIFSDNDYFVPLSNIEIYKSKLNAEVRIEKAKGHFTEDDNVTKLPILLEFFEKTI
jgi:uncharacterized protein